MLAPPLLDSLAQSQREAAAVAECTSRGRREEEVNARFPSLTCAYGTMQNAAPRLVAKKPPRASCAHGSMAENDSRAKVVEGEEEVSPPIDSVSTSQTPLTV